MPRNTILLIWLGGIAVAAIAYAAGPDQVLDRALDLLAAAIAATDQFIHDLSTFGSAVMRAVTVGLFATFVALAIVAIRRGARGKTALITVSITFLFLLHGGDGGVSNTAWAGAFLLAAISALVMTARIRRGPP